MSACSCKSCGESLCPGDVLCGTCGEPCDPDENRGFRIKRPIERGDTLVLEFAPTVPGTGQSPNLADSGSKAWFTIKDYLSRWDLQALFQGTIGAGIEIQGGVGNRIVVTVPAAATSVIPDGLQRLYYDLQILWNGRVWTAEKGLFEVSPDVTRATS
jgi:hypothetical protein